MPACSSAITSLSCSLSVSGSSLQHWKPCGEPRCATTRACPCLGCSTTCGALPPPLTPCCRQHHLCFSAARLNCRSFLLRAISFWRSCFLQARQEAARREAVAPAGCARRTCGRAGAAARPTHLWASAGLMSRFPFFFTMAPAPRHASPAGRVACRRRRWRQVGAGGGGLLPGCNWAAGSRSPGAQRPKLAGGTRQALAGSPGLFGELALGRRELQGCGSPQKHRARCPWLWHAPPGRQSATDVGRSRTTANSPSLCLTGRG